jgi:hypothetical protein
LTLIDLGCTQDEAVLRNYALQAPGAGGAAALKDGVQSLIIYIAWSGYLSTEHPRAKPAALLSKKALKMPGVQVT